MRFFFIKENVPERLCVCVRVCVCAFQQSLNQISVNEVQPKCE